MAARLLVLGDTAKTLSPQMNIRFEREANQGAAELLFQLDLHERIARDYPTDITTPIALALPNTLIQLRSHPQIWLGSVTTFSGAWCLGGAA